MVILVYQRVIGFILILAMRPPHVWSLQLSFCLVLRFPFGVPFEIRQMVGFMLGRLGHFDGDALEEFVAMEHRHL